MPLVMLIQLNPIFILLFNIYSTYLRRHWSGWREKDFRPYRTKWCCNSARSTTRRIMSDGESMQSRASSPTIDVGNDGPCTAKSDVLSTSNHRMQISPIRTSIRSARAVGGVTAIKHNKSCDSCRSMKKKCDGLRPCRCVQPATLCSTWEDHDDH